MARKHMHRGTSRSLAGNLCDVCVNRLLEVGWHHGLTGVVRINSWGHSGVIKLEHGEVREVRFGTLRGERAMSELTNLRDGIFEMVSSTPISLDAPLDVSPPARTDTIPVPENETVTPAPARVSAGTPVEPIAQPASGTHWTPQNISPTWTPQNISPTWTPQNALPAWTPQNAAGPQPHVRAESVPMLTRRLPTLGPTLGFSLLGLTLLVMVASQL